MNTLRQDSLAGIVVFLVALPLCLGIAQASGLPPFVGLLTGIIGGLVVTALSPSRFAVSGPAAGLVTIVVAAIESLGSFSLFLMARCSCCSASCGPGALSRWFPPASSKACWRRLASC